MPGIPIITGFDLSAASPIDNRFVMPDQPTREAISWKYAGLLVYQTDVQQYFYYDGTTWIAVIFSGTPGPPGSVWYNATGVPLSGLGVNGDYYLDDATGDVYNKIAGAWVLVSNIKGPQGTPGAVTAAYGSLLVNAGVLTQVIDATNQKINQFTVDGPYSNTNPEQSNDRIIILSSGYYVIYFIADVLGPTNKKFVVTIYINGSPTNWIGTFDTASNNTPNVALQYPLELSSGDIIELYIKQTSGGTATFTILTAQFGVFGIKSKGDAGKALIHTEHDIVLNETNMGIIAAGTWTLEDPYSASVIADSRSNLSLPSGLAGNKVGHSISYNGVAWSDNGIWRGPGGPPGSPGTPGASGISATGGTKIYQQTYNFNSEAMGALGVILAHSAFWGKVYTAVTFVTPLESSLKVKLEFTTQFKGDNSAVEDTTRWFVQRSSNGGVTWNDILGPYDFRGGNAYRTTVQISGVDTSAAANTSYMYRLVGYNFISSDNNWFANSAGYCITLIPG